MKPAEISIIVALLLSPVVAICISLWYQGRKEKRQQKFNSFFALVAHREDIGVHPGFVSQLNTIDIVFHDCPKILAAWRKYHDNLHTDNSPQALTARRHLKLDLLHEIAQHLGYKKWKQTDMEKYYIPIAFQDQHLSGIEFQAELLCYLKNGNRVYEKMLEQMQQNGEETRQLTS